MRTAISGHRPEKLEGRMEWVESALRQAYADLSITCVVQGMAAGVDLLSAKCAYYDNVPFWCARPWAGHAPRVRDRINYQQALTYAEKVIDVDPATEYPGVWAYDKRNRWMVDNSEMLIAVWNGDQRGGTWNCVKYAMKQNATIYRLDPVTETAGWYA